jgi:hypothetical protein
VYLIISVTALLQAEHSNVRRSKSGLSGSIWVRKVGPPHQLQTGCRIVSGWVKLDRVSGIEAPLLARIIEQWAAPAGESIREE